MHVEQLKYFVDAIDCKSISGAAKKSFITQSALSQSILNLENELGAKLLVRSKQGISATAFGRVVYDDSKEIIKLVEKYKEKWNSIVCEGTPISGEVKIVVFPSAGNVFIDRIMPELNEAYPNMVVTLYEEGPMVWENERLVMDKYDATLCLWSCFESEISDRIKENEKRGYITEILYSGDPLHLLLSSKHPLAKNEFVYDYQLADLPVAFYADEPVPNYFKYFDQSKYYKLQHYGIIMRFVASNNAAAVFPKMVSDAEPYLKNKQIVSIPIISNDLDAFPKICRYLVRKNDEELTEAEKRAISIIKYYMK